MMLWIERHERSQGDRFLFNTDRDHSTLVVREEYKTMFVYVIEKS